MNKYSLNKFSYDKFLKFSILLYLFLPIAIVIGNFSINAIILYSLIIIIYLLYKIKVTKFFFEKEVVYLTIFFLYLIINSLLNNDEYVLYSTLKYLRFYFFSLAIYYLLIIDDEFYKKLTFIFFGLFLLLLFDGFYQYFKGYNLIGLQQTVPHRVSSFFGDELVLGSFISKYLPFVILFFLIKKNHSPFFAPTLLILLILTFIAGERTAFATTILIIFFTIIKLYDLKKIIIFSTSILSSLVLVIYLDDVTKDRMIFQTIDDLKILSEWKNPKSFKIYTKQHNAHFQSAYLMYKKGNFVEKFFGRGVKSFRNNCSKREFCDASYCCSTHPHNIFLQVLAEIGLIGLFFYLYFILYLLYNSAYLFIKKKDDKKYIILISILLNYLPFLTSGNIFGTFLSTNFFLLISILLYFNYAHKR